jgi:D-glycero-alpha-D-manno-heptose-7-phosphate kinase
MVDGTLMDRAIRARAPLRLGLAGGGTDLSPFCDEFGGSVMNATVALYAYAHLIPRTDGRIRFEAAEQGEHVEVDAAPFVEAVGPSLLHRGVYNRIVKEFNGGRPLSLTLRTTVDVPSGSGMGGSSALVVAILEAYRHYLQLPFGEYDLAQLAFDIERNDLKLAGGKQDQYAAAFGGFNFMEFYADNRVIVNPLRVRPSVVRELEASLVLYYTGSSRQSAQIIEAQQKNVVHANTKSVEAMKALKREAIEMKEALLRGSMKDVASTLERGWVAKKATASAVSNTEIDRILEKSIEHGALAGKVSGAGGGGFVLILTEATSRQRILDMLAKEPGRVLPCNFVDDGALSWASPY